MQWDLITNIILIAAIAVVGVFAFLGLYQLVTRKSIQKIDPELRWFPLPLILMVITYIVFDKFIILNTRPDGSGEPSFPSTHVMVVTTIFFLVILILPHYVKNKVLCIILEFIMVVLIGFTCTGRVLADKHWISDVIGAIIFAFIFSEIYYQIFKRSKKNAKHLHANHQQ